MAGTRTIRAGTEAAEFLAGIADPRLRADASAVCAMMAEVTGEPPTMWGPGIVGFGRYHYRYADGRTGESLAIGFSPRRAGLTLYLTDGLDGHADLVARLGPVTIGTCCLHVKRLADVDQAVLRDLITRSFRAADGRTA